MSRSLREVFGSAAKVQILPLRSATTQRLVPGTKASSSGSSKVRSEKTRSRKDGWGGSGAPLTWEVVQGTRRSRPTGASRSAARLAKAPTRVTAARSRQTARVRYMVSLCELRANGERTQAVFYPAVSGVQFSRCGNRRVAG